MQRTLGWCILLRTSLMLNCWVVRDNILNLLSHLSNHLNRLSFPSHSKLNHLNNYHNNHHSSHHSNLHSSLIPITANLITTK